MSIDEAMQAFTNAGWPTEEWPTEEWRDAAEELVLPDSIHRGDMASIVAHLNLWN